MRPLAVFILWTIACTPSPAKSDFNAVRLTNRLHLLRTADRHGWRLAVRGGALLPAAANQRLASHKKDGHAQEKGASTAMMTFNLVKGILGSGILALPAGIATLTSPDDVSTGNDVLVPAVLMLALTGMVSAYGFTLIGLICDATGATTYREAWSLAVGRPLPGTGKASRSTPASALSLPSKTSWMPAVACLAVTFCTTLTYTMVIADMLPQLLPMPLSRIASLLGLASILAPICLMQELKKLAPVSIVGLIGTIFTALAMAFRWYQHTGKQIHEGGSLSLLTRLPRLQSPAIFLSMLSTSFMSHYNAPRVFWELHGGGDANTGARHPSLRGEPSQRSVSKFVTVVRYGFGAATLVMALIATSGYAVYGKSSASNILTSYPSSDKLMSLGRGAIAISLICTFPLAFVGIRNQFMELAGLSRTVPSVNTAVTFGILAVLVIVAYFVRDLRIVLAVGGSTWGNAVIYLFPSLMLLHAAPKYPELLRTHVPFATLTGIMGLILASMGSRRIMALIRNS